MSKLALRVLLRLMFYAGKKFVLGVLLFVLVLVYWAVWEKENQKVEVIFLNVGQGDAELIKLPGDIQILIDSGPSKNITAKLSQHLPFYDKDIELAVLTHPHADHISGFLGVLKDYNVKNFLLSGANYESKIYSDFINALEQEGSKTYVAKLGDIVSFGDIPIMKILWPNQIELGRNFKDIHDSTVVSELNLGNRKFLFMGDAGENIEQLLVASNAIEDADVLKVGHHGSKNSTSEKFLEAAKPEEAIISVGNNSYGHPYIEVLNFLRERGVKIFRTDEVGDVVYK